ncbi:TPA: DUF5339 family protein [Salmonella enterica]
MPGENLLEYSFWRYSENILPAFITTSGGWFFIQKGSVSMKAITVLLTATLFSVSASAALTPACEEYYKEIDNFVAKMKETGTPEAQLNTLKQQYEQSRQQIAALPDASQDMACKQGLDALRQSMSAAGIK